MDLPASISTGRVVGQFVVGVIDGADANDEPDLIPARGTIAFTPSIPYLQVPVASPNPFTVLETTKIGVLDALGYLCTPDPSNPSKPGARGVRLISTDNKDASVKDWTWIATPQFEDVNGTVLRNVIKPTPFHLPGNETRDLTNVVKVPASEGIGTDQALALAEAAQQAAQSAASNVEGALAAAKSAQASARAAAADLAEFGSDLAGAVEREIVTEWTAANSSLRELATSAATSATEPLAGAVAAIPAKIASAAAPKLDKVEAANTFAVKPDNGGKPVGKGELDYNQFTRAYRKKVIHHLPFKHAGYASAKALWGDYYPQSFAVDEVADELFISSQGALGVHCIVTVYTWSTGALKTTFAYPAAYGSEGAVILREGGRRYLYGRTGVDGLGRVDITTLPPLNSVAPVVDTYATNQGINFTHRNGVWTVADNTPPIGGQVSRGSFKRLNSAFKYIGSMFVEERLIGGNPVAYRQSVMPKMQGFAEGAGCYLIAVGGYTKRGAAFDNYGLNGIRVVTGQGKSVVDSLADPHRMMEVLGENGIPCTRLENEGVQLVGGKIVTLQVTDANSSTGGILFLEEFSDSTSAIDFSSCAYTWTMPDVTSMQSGMQPRASDSKLYNQATAEPLSTMQQITEYMAAVGQNIFRFYSSSVSILDIDGVAIPSGHLITIYNCNNSTYRAHFEGGGALSGWWQYYTAGSGAFTKMRVAEGVVIQSAGGKKFMINVSDTGAISTTPIS